MIPDWLNESHLSLFPEDLQSVAQRIGFENLLKLMDDYRSTEIYFPRLEKITAKVRNDGIRKEFDGRNHKALAQKYKLSLRYIYQILKEEHTK